MPFLVLVQMKMKPTSRVVPAAKVWAYQLFSRSSFRQELGMRWGTGDALQLEDENVGIVLRAVSCGSMVGLGELEGKSRDLNILVQQWDQLVV